MTNLNKKITIADLNNYKKTRQKIVCLTAYSAPIAKILDPICDVILVGDSLAMTIYGHSNTRQVSLNTMIEHGKAVSKFSHHSLVVVDLPFNSYENSLQQALHSAQQVINQCQCDAIKIETTQALVPTVEYLVANNIKVMAHIGLLPQTVENSQDFRYQGRNQEQAQEILKTALALEKAGAFAIVIEAVPEELASKISQQLKIPTIGIGASKDCDGQVLVIDDLLGINPDFCPKFVHKYFDLHKAISQAVNEFASDVRTQKFPFPNNLLTK